MKISNSTSQEMIQGLCLSHLTIMNLRCGHNNTQSFALQVPLNLGKARTSYGAHCNPKASNSTTRAVGSKKGVRSKDLNKPRKNASHDAYCKNLDRTGVQNELSREQERL